MEIEEAFNLFKQGIDEKNRSWSQDRHKIENFIKKVGRNRDVIESMNESNFVTFFETLDRNSLGYYYALKKFYTFVQEEILKQPLSGRMVFPIEIPKDKNIDEKSKKPKANYLPEGFNFFQLFHNDFYVHLQNETASLTIKACIAVGLGAGYNTGDIKKMTVDDVQLDGDKVRVKNVHETESVPWILLKGEIAEYIKKYYDLLTENDSSLANSSQPFFRKYWIGRELEIDPDILNMNSDSNVDKPSNIIQLLTYMLRYISIKADIDPHIYPTHLHINAIFHQLLQTNGKALESVMRTFGWERVARESFYQYIKSREQKESIGFDPFNSISTSGFNHEQKKDSEELDGFFLRSSLDDETKSGEDIINIEFLKRRKRDTKRVKMLKILYKNCCQICGEALVDISGIGYSEVNHIQPLSKHNGIDKELNMIVLCPNHHTLMDMGVITLDPSDRMTILHVDENNPLHLAKLVIVKHSLSEKYIQYHHDMIFKFMKERLRSIR